MSITIRATIIVALLPLLSGCTLFAPRFDPELAARVDDAHVQVGQLLSEAEFGRYQSAESFDGALTRYAEIDAKLSTAEQSANALDAPTAASRRARDLLVGQVTGCRTQMRELAVIHRREGIAPNAGITANARVSCNAAAHAAHAME